MPDELPELDELDIELGITPEMKARMLQLERRCCGRPVMVDPDDRDSTRFVQCHYGYCVTAFCGCGAKLPGEFGWVGCPCQNKGDQNG